MKIIYTVDKVVLSIHQWWKLSNFIQSALLERFENGRCLSCSFLMFRNNSPAPWPDRKYRNSKLEKGCGDQCGEWAGSKCDFNAGKSLFSVEVVKIISGISWWTRWSNVSLSCSPHTALPLTPAVTHVAKLNKVLTTKTSHLPCSTPPMLDIWFPATRWRYPHLYQHNHTHTPRSLGA